VIFNQYANWALFSQTYFYKSCSVKSSSQSEANLAGMAPFKYDDPTTTYHNYN